MGEFDIFLLVPRLESFCILFCSSKFILFIRVSLRRFVTSHGFLTPSKLDHHLYNIAAAAVTNEKAILEALVSTNAKLTKVSADKLLRIEQLLRAMKPSGLHPLQGTAMISAAPNDTGAISQLHAAITYKWVPGAFCSTHGWGVGPDHSSSSSKGKKPGNINSSMHANPQGPGAAWNKGWDNFLSS